jgi:anti-sigma regulatory factor (Ser/Thr protein kinase)
MVNNMHVALKANDRSYFALLKKEVHTIALNANFNARKIGEIDIIVAELATNLVKHAGGGHLLVKLVNGHDIEGIEIISIDNGPGMTDVNKMTTDGISTQKTLGLGLGAIIRLSDTCQIFTQKTWGTVILCRKFKKSLPAQAKPPKAEIRSVVVAKPGEEICGDGFFSVVTKDHVKLFLGDGLGHGPDAAHAVQEAGKAFTECLDTYPPDILRYINGAVRKTRGLVGTVAIFDLKLKRWELCGVGNISTRINGPALAKSYMAYNGIIGLNIPRTLNAQEIIHEKGQYLTMCSDGIKSRWETNKFTGILRFDLSVLAAALFKDFSRQTDDASVAICKINM